MKNHSIGAAAIALAAFCGAGAALAGDFQIGNLSIAQPWSRPTPPVASSGVVYFSITNRGSRQDRLVAASSPAAKSAEIHESRTVGGLMEMRQLAVLDCPPHATVKIEPGGVHVMLVGLRGPLAPGTDFPLTLRFATAGELTVQVHVSERE